MHSGAPDTELAAAFSTAEAAVADIRAGKFVVVVDTAAGHGWGGLTIAAEHATVEAVNFMLTEARGPLYLCLSGERCDELGLSSIGTSPLRSGASFMVSIEAREGITSGVSAEDRARTIRAAADPSLGPADFVYPGHVPVMRARPSGVLERARQTEAAVDLGRLAGLQPAGVFAEVLNADGSAASGPELVEYARTHDVKLLNLGDLVLHRRRSEQLVEQVVNVRMPTMRGEFRTVAFREVLTGEQHVALVKGEISPDEGVLVRVHRQCLVGDVFHAGSCDCGEDLDAAINRMEAEGRGILLYLSRPERGLGLLWRIASSGDDAAVTHPISRAAEEQTDVRDFGIGSQILVELGARRVRILTDNARDLTGVDMYGLEVVEQVPLRGEPSKREHHQGLALDDAISP